MTEKAKVVKFDGGVVSPDALLNPLTISNDCKLDLSLIDDLDDVLEINIINKSSWALENSDLDVYLVNKFKAGIFELKFIDSSNGECIETRILKKYLKEEFPIYISQIESIIDLYWLDIEEIILNSNIVDLRLDYDLHHRILDLNKFITTLLAGLKFGMRGNFMAIRSSYAFKLASLFTCIAHRKLSQKNIYGTKKKKSVSTKVYLITDRQSNVCKIGISQNPSKRLNDLQTCYPYPLTLEYTFKGDLTTERGLHKKFDNYRLSGEWFSLNKEILDYFHSRKTN